MARSTCTSLHEIHTCFVPDFDLNSTRADPARERHYPLAPCVRHESRRGTCRGLRFRVLCSTQRTQCHRPPRLATPALSPCCRPGLEVDRTQVHVSRLEQCFPPPSSLSPSPRFGGRSVIRPSCRSATHGAVVVRLRAVFGTVFRPSLTRVRSCTQESLRLSLLSSIRHQKSPSTPTRSGSRSVVVGVVDTLGRGHRA